MYIKKKRVIVNYDMKVYKKGPIIRLLILWSNGMTLVFGTREEGSIPSRIGFLLFTKKKQHLFIKFHHSLSS